VTPWLELDGVTVFHGDCIEVMRQLPDNSVHAVVTDPPYGIGFMGKAWDGAAIAAAAKKQPMDHTKTRERSASMHAGSYDLSLTGNTAYQVWFTDVATEALRVLKPGGHLLAFGGTRTWHRLAVAIEDAGFEVRDSVAWMYGSGFPKSLDVSKAIDKRGGAVAGFAEFRDAVKLAMKRNEVSRAQLQQSLGNFMLSHYLTAGSQPAIPNWRDYQIIRDCVGLGDTYDELFIPEAERKVVGKSAHKSGIANGVEGHHTVGGTRAEHYDITAPATPAAEQWQGWGTALKPAHEPIVVARKPLIGTVAENVLTHGTGALNIDGCRIGTRESEPQFRPASASGVGNGGVAYGARNGQEAQYTAGRWPANVILDESQAAELDKQSGVSTSVGVAKFKPRSVYNADAEGYDINGQEIGYGDTGGASRFFYVAKASKKERPNVDGIAHPTVKPLALMRYLVRLVTPPGGTVLEPFAGSGATVEACIEEGFNCIAIEREADYLPLIQHRIQRANEATAGRLL
jgi:DNA modification methylase